MAHCFGSYELKQIAEIKVYRSPPYLNLLRSLSHPHAYAPSHSMLVLS